MQNLLKLAICQMQTGPNKADNLARAGDMVSEAAGNGANLVVLPEIFNTPYQTDVMAAQAELFPGPTSTFLSALAHRLGIVLVGGSIAEKDLEGRIFNTSYTFDPQGTLIGKYRKIHLFDVDIPGRIVFRESSVLSPGDQLQVIRYQGLTMAVMICYDIRFPELARWAALSGAHLLVVPAAFNMTTGPAHWEILFRTRAVDNQLFVAAASPARNPAANYQAWGHSMLIDPWGTIISQAGSDETIIYAELDLDLLRRIRQELPLLKHRRTDLYHLGFPPRS